MRKDRGFMLINDVIIFLLCSMLVLSTAKAWKTCTMRQQQYKELTRAMHLMENYIAFKEMPPAVNITKLQHSLSIGTLSELQLWEDDAHERLLINLFIVEKES